MMRSRMTLLPKLMSHWWETLDRPHRLLDQHFGIGVHPETFIKSFFDDFDRRFWSVYNRSWVDVMQDNKLGWSIVKDDKEKFHVVLDVQQFKPEEINVKVIDNCVVIEGKHEEKQDDHGMISRHFVRKYMIPEQCESEKAQCTLSSDGVLTVTAPRKPESIANEKEKVIKIEHVDKPAIENQQQEEIKQRAEQ